MHDVLPYNYRSFIIAEPVRAGQRASERESEREPAIMVFMKKKKPVPLGSYCKVAAERGEVEGFFFYYNSLSIPAHIITGLRASTFILMSAM
jgi:hypothetical protein